MTDMTPFERQLSGEIAGLMGPTRPVDAVAIVAAITAVRSPARSVHPLVGGARLLFAGVVVATLGGFLLAGGLTMRPSEGQLSAAGASPSPATTPDLLPGVDLVTEEVEPGVFRVLSDGTDNDMALAARYPYAIAQAVAGPDGSVWVLDGPLGEGRLFRLGEAGWHDASRLHDYTPDVSVAPDGLVWALGDGANRYPDEIGAEQLWSLDDRGWTAHAVPDDVRVTGIETPADGSVWASWGVGGFDDFEDCVKGSEGRRLAVARLVDGEWIRESVEPATLAGDGGSLAVGPDGTALLGTIYYNTCPSDAWIGVLERDEDGWMPSATLDPAGPVNRAGIGPIAIASDGTVWAYQHGGANPEPWRLRLLRRAAGDWEVLGDDESVPMLMGTQMWRSSMTASADGRLWIALDGPEALDTHRDWGKSVAATLDGPCAGVLSFDGIVWSHHLAGACATHVSAAPNGNVWVTVVGAGPASRAGVYVITPAAVGVADPGLAAR